jgi:hypothetical protein
MFKKIGFVIVLIVVVVAAIYVRNLQSTIRDLRSERDSVIQVDENNQAVLASHINELADARALARNLNAELIAAASISVQAKTDTVTKVVRVPVEVLKDSTRIAYLVDTVSAGILTATITAPPCCGDLGFEYIFAPSPIDITVSLLRVENNQAMFGVTYYGGTVEVSAPFARIPTPEPWATAYVTGLYNFDKTVQARLGGELRLITAWGIYGLGEITQDIVDGATPQFYIGVKKRL